MLMAAVGVVMSYLVLSQLAEEQETALLRTTRVYVNGIATATQSSLIREDIWETFDVLDRSRGDGLETTVVAVVLPSGTILAASDPVRLPVGAAVPPPFTSLEDGRLRRDEVSELAWYSHRVVSDGRTIGRIVAEIDISGQLAVRSAATWALIGVNAAVTLGMAAIGYGIVRRMLRPAGMLTAHLEDPSNGRPRAFTDAEIRKAGPEFAPLFARFNAMAQAVADREALTTRLSQEERVAHIGRFASAMAHEVNNPLGGLLTAVDTLAVHGADQSVRDRSIALLRHGLGDIHRVVQTILATYKQRPGDADRLSAADLDGLEVLVDVVVRQRRLHLDWANRIDGSVRMDATATRQVILNLLLNACQASPVGETVVCILERDAEALMVTLIDRGPGMPDAASDLLTRREALPVPVGSGLGLWVVRRLLDRLGAAVSVEKGTAGTTIHLVVPVSKARNLDAAA